MSTGTEIAADVAVAGGGPAGVAAACRAAEAGARVVLLDEGLAPGGQIWRAGPGVRPPAAARRWLARLARSGARIVPLATVADADPAGALWGEVDGRPLAVSWRRLVVATGARERFLPFPGWTLPGVLGVGAAQALLKSGWEVRGKKIAVAGTGPLLLPVAALLASRGAEVVLVAEQAPAAALRRFAGGLWRRPGKLLAAARLRAGFLAAPYRAGAWVTEAEGDGRVEEVVWTDGARGARRQRERCDVLCCAYGLVPNLELPRLLGCRIDGGFAAVDGSQETSVSTIYCAGEPTGIAGVEAALSEGEIAGLAAAGSGIPAALRRRRDRGRAWAAALAAAFPLRPEILALARPETIVCRCEDVRWGDLDPAWGPRQAKLASRAGMGPCQGRVCGPALAALAGRDDWLDGAARAPLKPVSLATLAAWGAAARTPPASP